MTYDDIIGTFKKHLSKLNYYGTDFEVWLSTAMEHVHENFGLLSPQHDSITQIKNDYRLARIRDNSADLQNVYAKKIAQLIENFIEQLEEKKRIAIVEANRKQQAGVKKEFKLQQQLDELSPKYDFLFTENRRLQKELQTSRNQPKPKRTYWKIINGVYHINISLFWTLIPLALALTIYLTSLKFDNDKINLYEKNQELKSDTANLSTELRAVKSQIEEMKSKTNAKDSSNSKVHSKFDTLALPKN